VSLRLLRSRQLLNPVDLGWFAVRTAPHVGWGTSGLGFGSSGLEATVNRSTAVAVAMPQGQSRVPNPSSGCQ